jgi:hypothetical protein
LDADLDDERNGSVLKMEFTPAIASRTGRRTCKMGVALGVGGRRTGRRTCRMMTKKNSS